MPEIQTPKPAVDLACWNDRFLLRIEDHANPEFWTQLELDSFGNLIRAEGKHFHPTRFDATNIIVVASHAHQFCLQVRDSLNKHFALNVILTDESEAEVAHLFHPTFPTWL